MCLRVIWKRYFPPKEEIQCSPDSILQENQTADKDLLLLMMDPYVLRKVIGRRCKVNPVTFVYWKEAEEFLQSHTPRLLILSYLQFDSHAPEIIETLRRNPKTRELPIILLLQRSPDSRVEQEMRAYEEAGVVAKISDEIGLLLELVKQYAKK